MVFKIVLQMVSVLNFCTVKTYLQGMMVKAMSNRCESGCQHNLNLDLSDQPKWNQKQNIFLLNISQKTSYHNNQ